MIFPGRKTKSSSIKPVSADNYFQHVDGIRTIAVVPVILYHLLERLTPGGYAGVDVFFVISGFLITGGIIRDLGRNEFTIKNFYHRRIRRILPAYFFLILGVLATSLFLYYDSPMIRLGNALSASTLFMSNLHFLKLGGDYFAADVHGQPLLHLWSLSVEEQFYVFIPLFCSIIWRFNKRLLLPLLILFASLSLVSAVREVWIGKQMNAFYLLHYRAWELLTGSILALVSAKSRLMSVADDALGDRARSPWFRWFLAGLPVLGLSMVVIPYAVMSSRTPFPGLSALSPVLGTALLIRFGQSGWVGRILSSRPFTQIGKMSYSLYLWHWPVIVFWKYAIYDQTRVADYIGMLVVSFLMAYLSWRFVETPVRVSRSWNVRRTFAFACAGIILLTTVGTVVVAEKGWPDSLHAGANRMAYMPEPTEPFVMMCALDLGVKVEKVTRHHFTWISRHLDQERKEALDYTQDGDDGDFPIGASGRPVVFLIGDSHAGALRYGLDALLRAKGIPGYSISRSSTEMFDANLDLGKAALAKVEGSPSGTKVLLATHWAYYGDMDRTLALLEGYVQSLKSKKLDLYVLGDVPYRNYSPFDIDARRVIVRPRWLRPEWVDHKMSQEAFDLEQGIPVNLRLQSLCDKYQIKYVPLQYSLLENNHYLAFENARGTRIPLYRDSNHLSNAGSIRAAQFLWPYLLDQAP